VVLVALAVAGPACPWGALEVGVVCEDAEGFAGGEPVLYKGVHIGEVTGVALEAGRPVVLAEIDSEHKSQVRTGALFRLQTPGLLGGGDKALVLEEAGSGEPLVDRARVQATTQGQMLLDRAQKAVAGAAEQIAKAIDELPDADSEEVQEWLDGARAAAEAASQAGAEAAERFEKETLPKLRAEMEALRRRLEESGKLEQARRVADEFGKLPE